MPSDRDALEQALEAYRDRDQRQRAQIDAVIESISFNVQGKIIDANRRATEMFGYTPEELIGMTPLDFVAPESRAQAIANIGAGSEEVYEIIAVRKDGTRFPAEVCARTVAYRDGKARVVVVLDIAQRKAAEAALRQGAVQEETLRARAETLERLATPVLPIHREVVVVPLVGEMGESRCRRVTEELVSGVATSRARIAIIDITGVPAVDEQVASMLVAATRTVGLLGVRVILTGLSPEVATTLVGLDVDLSSVTTMGTLQQGVAWALGRLG
jgi:PAS domain S-box-containing protein